VKHCPIYGDNSISEKDFKERTQSMNLIIEKVTDPAFTIPTLIIAIAAGIVVSYLHSGIDILISHFMGKYTEKKEARRREQEKEASSIASHSVLLNRASAHTASGRIECIIFLATLIVLVCFVVALPAKTPLGALLFFVSIGFISGSLARLYRDLRKDRKMFWKAMAIHFKDNE
jgi:hypothetical protein